MEQIDIETLILEKTEAGQLLAAFLIFHRDNPGVWDQIRTMANNLIAKGRKRYSMQTIIEVIRHHTLLGYADQDRDFKINNNYVAVYSRVWNHLYGAEIQYKTGQPFFTTRISFLDRLTPEVLDRLYLELDVRLRTAA